MATGRIHPVLITIGVVAGSLLVFAVPSALDRINHDATSGNPALENSYTAGDANPPTIHKKKRKPETDKQDSSVDDSSDVQWDQYDPSVKTNIDEMVAQRDCVGLHTEFWSWQSPHGTHAPLMFYIYGHAQKAACDWAYGL